MGFYVICDDDSKHEGMTKEQILAAIAQAVETGSIGNCDTGFITKVKEINAGGYVTFWVGTRAQYNALESKVPNCMYIITDDTTDEDLMNFVETMQKDMTALKVQSNHVMGYCERLAAAATCVDFSDNVRLQYDINSSTGEITASYIDAAEYIYSPALHAVFFRFGLVFQGVIEKGKWIVLEHSAKDTTKPNYIPHKNYTYPITARSDRYFAEYIDNKVWIHALEDIDTAGAGTQVIDVSGWYFCDEE